MSETAAAAAAELAAFEVREIPRSCFGLDIGGTLCKISYFERLEGTEANEPAEARNFRRRVADAIAAPENYGSTGSRDSGLEFACPELGGRIYLMRFATHRMASFLQLLKELNVVDATTLIGCTGGGARKFSSEFTEGVGVTLCKADELSCLVNGINFVLAVHPDELYSVHHATYVDTGEQLPLELDGSSFPYLLVNVGSGVSILQVNQDGTHERVGGTSLGGATFFGLCALVTGCETFSEALQLAEQGKGPNVDLLVSDIYGGAYEEYNLSADTVAASLGKLVNPEVRKGARKEDVARGILDAITNNIGSLALLHAKRLKLSKLIFSGSFFRDNRVSVARLSFAVKYWSKGVQEAGFLVHEGYLGSLGALLNAGGAL